MKKPIHVGVVGYGYWGPNLVRNLCSMPDCKVVMVCEHSPESLGRLRAAHPGIPSTSDYRHLIGLEHLDAVMIATPLETHYPLAKQALMAGKHVFIEKPMADSTDHCEELIVHARKEDLVLMVGHTFRYSPFFRKVEEVVASGEIGSIRYITARRLNLGTIRSDTNVIWDLASHDLSMIIPLMGDMPTSVNCVGGPLAAPGIEGFATMCLNFPGDRWAFIQSSWLHPSKVREVTVVGTEKMVVYDDVAGQDNVRVFDAKIVRLPHYENFGEFQHSHHHGDIHAPYVKGEEPLKLECRHFLNCITTGSQPISGGERGLQIIRILEVATESLLRGGVPVNISTPQPPKSSSLRSPLRSTLARMEAVRASLA